MPVPTKSKAKAAAILNNNRPGYMFRSFLVWTLVALAGIGIIIWTSASWIERQLLTTDKWVAYASILPGNSTISEGLSLFIADRIFTRADVEERVEEALPPRAGFLATPLTAQLETFARGVVQEAVESDRFVSIWASANRSAHQRMLERARSDPLLEEQPEFDTRFEVDLSAVGPLLHERLGNASEVLPENGEKIALLADLQVRRGRFSQYVRSIDFLQSVLPFFCVAVGLGALAIAYDRRLALLAGSALIVVLSLLQLIFLNVFRASILARIQNDTYLPAVAAAYDSLVSSLSAIVYWVIAAAFVVWVAMILAGPGRLGSRLRRFIHMNEIQETLPYVLWRKFRLWVADQKYFLWALFAILALFYLAFVTDIDWRIALNTFFGLLAALALVQVLGSPSYLIKSKR